jgi:superfamily I DNA and/or RNA helicase
MNVAMTRARYRLVIVGNTSTLGEDVFYATLVQYVEKHGAYHSVYEYLYG